MPSLVHEEARSQTRALLLAVAPPADLVASELPVMWDPSDLRRYLMPDLMLVRSAGRMDVVYKVPRRQYRIWQENRAPDLVIEFASPSTVSRDTLGKKEDYATLGVREYVQFDPLEEMFRPGLRVYRLRGGVYLPATPARDGSVASAVLRGYAWLKVEEHLRLRDRTTGRLVPTPEEARRQAEQQRAQEAAARQRAEQQRAQEAAARQRAEEEREREAAARQRAEEEREREAAARRAAEAHAARLEAELQAALAIPRRQQEENR
jgi:hypothetical protein